MDLNISDFEIEHLFLHIRETHAKVVAAVLNPINPLYPSIDEKVDNVNNFRSNYLAPKTPLFKRTGNQNTHDDTEDEKYTQLLADKLFLVQIGIASSKTKLSTEEMKIYYGEMLDHYRAEVETKLNLPKYAADKALRGAWSLEKAELPAVPAGGDALRDWMTDFQARFAQNTLVEWWNLYKPEFEIEHRFLVIRRKHASVVESVLRGVNTRTINISNEVGTVHEELSKYPAPVVPLYRRCKEPGCGIDLLDHSFQHISWDWDK